MIIAVDLDETLSNGYYQVQVLYKEAQDLWTFLLL